MGETGEPEPELTEEASVSLPVWFETKELSESSAELLDDVVDAADDETCRMDAMSGAL